MNSEFNTKVRELVNTDPRYAAEAYSFVSDAVTFTVNRLKEHRHVSAGELLSGMRDFAEKEYGVLAREVLQNWGIFTASDIGELVYLLISVQILSASPGDKRSDFDIDYLPYPQMQELSTSKEDISLPKID